MSSTMSRDMLIEIPGLVPQGGKRGGMVGVFALPDYPAPKTLAIVWPSDEFGGWWINNIKVLPELWGQGLGRRMLMAILDAADQQGQRLALAVEPDKWEGLDYDQLFAWYGRHGFVEVPEYDGFTLQRDIAA